MNVTFTKTGEKRYKVAVDGPGVVPAEMDPAPGFDTLLPHDMAHFVVENELGLMGVFGQLAGGGNAGSFRPIVETKGSRAEKRGKRILAENRKEAELSERVIFLAQRTWMKGDLSDVPTIKEVTAEDITRIGEVFEAVSSIWSRLAIGESMTLVWRGIKKPAKGHERRKK